MKACRIVTVAVAGVLSTALLLGQTPTGTAKARGTSKKDTNAPAIILYDRQGKPVRTVGERALYEEVIQSPDRTRVAVVKNDQESGNSDLWILDIATGTNARITTSARSEFVRRPVWSPDGKQVAYVTIRRGEEGVYRRASNGTGPEELLYSNPGAFLMLSDWSSDGRFLSFATTVSGGILYVLPLGVAGVRKPIEVYHSESGLFCPRFSPDGRFLSYVRSKEGERNEVFVIAVDRSADIGPWQVSEGSRGSPSAGFIGCRYAVILAE